MALSEFDPAFNPTGPGANMGGAWLDVGYGLAVNEPQDQTVSGVGGAFGGGGAVSGVGGAFSSLVSGLGGLFMPGTAGDFPVYTGAGNGAGSGSALPTQTDIPALATGSNLLDRIGSVLGAIGSGGDSVPQPTQVQYSPGGGSSMLPMIVLGVGALAAVWMIAKG